MTYEEFTSAVEKHASEWDCPCVRTKARLIEDKHASSWELEKFSDDHEFLWIRYSPGGVSGGSCWEDSNPQGYTSSEELDFSVIDNILEVVNPTITYLQYKKLISNNDIFIHYEETKREYYGNCTDYKGYFISLRGLYDYLFNDWSAGKR